MDLDTSPASGAMDTPDAWRVADLHEAIGPLGLIASGAAKDAPEVAAELRQIREDLQSLVAEIERDPDARQRVNQTIQRIGESLFMMLRGDLLDLRFALPDALREEYVSPKGRYLVMMHPKENVWEYEPMKRFIADLRAVDPNVTGAPITHFESLGEMQRAFLQMAIYALLVIAAIVLLDFRKLRFMILTVIPTLVGLAWLVELMALLGISFNLANFFAVPILIGLSVDGTVHILHRYAEGGPTRFSLGATRRAVIVTAMTTMIGFGGLMLAHHRGLHSLGQVMVIGTACCLIATIVLLPVLLAWLERHKGLNDVGQSKGVFAKPPVRADAPTPRRRIAAADVRR
jgi:predicted RND superfamily exporter protein